MTPRLELSGGHAGVGGHGHFDQRVFAARERRLHVTPEHGCERLLVPPLGMLRREGLDAIEDEEGLKVRKR